MAPEYRDFSLPPSVFQLITDVCPPEFFFPHLYWCSSSLDHLICTEDKSFLSWHLEVQSRDLIAFTHPILHLKTTSFVLYQLAIYPVSPAKPPPPPQLCPLCFIHNRSPALPPGTASLLPHLQPLWSADSSFSLSTAVLKPHRHFQSPSLPHPPPPHPGSSLPPPLTVLLLEVIC